ncbi:DUF6103 domain-containing protein, partial [Dysosmobacter welbionis]
GTRVRHSTSASSPLTSRRPPFFGNFPFGSRPRSRTLLPRYSITPHLIEKLFTHISSASLSSTPLLRRLGRTQLPCSQPTVSCSSSSIRSWACSASICTL